MKKGEYINVYYIFNETNRGVISNNKAAAFVDIEDAVRAMKSARQAFPDDVINIFKASLVGDGVKV